MQSLRKIPQHCDESTLGNNIRVAKTLVLTKTEKTSYNEQTLDYNSTWSNEPTKSGFK
jgi:hypothetical protein